MAHANTIFVDLAALRSNLAVVRRIVGPERRIMACVKANAYGHDIIMCAKAALQAGADALGIARLDEAALLREAGIDAPVVLIAPESLAATDGLVALGVEIVVDSLARLEAVVQAARRRRRKAAVHVALDTGMGRFEASQGEAEQIVERVIGERALCWAGVMTHFPVADSDPESTREHWRRFDRITTGWKERGMPIPARHAANSAAILSLPETHADMVRPGLMLYGMIPCPGVPPGTLKPVLRWQTEVAALHWHEPGDSVGYGCTFKAPRRTLVATLPVGYGDGMSWIAGNRGWVLVQGKRAPILGRVSMDQTTVDATDVPGVALGDEVVLIGEQGSDRVTAEDWATWTGTINYEVTTRLLPRAGRVAVEA
jgi:alanine racemase